MILPLEIPMPMMDNDDWIEKQSTLHNLETNNDTSNQSPVSRKGMKAPALQHSTGVHLPDPSQSLSFKDDEEVTNLKRRFQKIDKDLDRNTKCRQTTIPLGDVEDTMSPLSGSVSSLVHSSGTPWALVWLFFVLLLSLGLVLAFIHI